MNFFQLSVIFILGTILSSFLFSLHFPLWVIISTMFIFVLAFVFVPQQYTVYRSNNLKSIEKYIRANQKKPIFAYALALANGDPSDIEESLRAILAKHKNPYMQNVYKTILALHLKKIDAATIYAQRIENEPLKSYYAAYVAAKQGNFEEAVRHEENIGVDWMIHDLHALYAREQGNHEEFNIESKKAIAQSRGVQKFIVLHSVNHL